MGKVIAITNQKGGVGKTTTAINFSCSLSHRGYRVLLIDLDPQAHATIGIGIEPRTYQHAIHDVLINKREIQEVVLPTKVNGLFLAPSHLRLDRAEQQLISEMYRESILHKAIAHLDYDFIVIDCRPTLGILTINALKACDFIIVPCEISRYSLEGFADLMETIENVKNPDFSSTVNFLRILLTKYDSRKSISIDWVMTQLKPYKNLLFKTRIRQNEALNQAHMSMEPIFAFKPRSAGAADYEEFTKEFLRLCRRSERS
jgi:chromosome partitioning protein